jgi:diacylglycerol kinase (ATP)
MKHIRVFHNPGAGTTDHSGDELIGKIEKMGFECSYNSTKKTDEDDFIDHDADIIAIAGGDGTVRKLVDQLLKRKILDKKFPIGLIPCGTANNIGRMLNISGTMEEIISRWKEEHIQHFDVAQVSGLKDTTFMMEGLGFGVFPKLIKTMEDLKREPDDPELELKMALKYLYEIVQNYKGRPCTITIDGKKHSGEYLMVEVMNIQSVGPNLNIAPTASISDGLLDVVLVPVAQREKFARYVKARLANGKDELFFGTSIKGSEIKVAWEGKLLHADDQLIQLKKPKAITLSARKGLIEFLV